MHLPEFILLVTATVAAIAAGLAVLASKYSIARILFWIAGLSFGSLGILWSAMSEGYSLSVQLVVSAAIAAIAAAGLTWALWEIKVKEQAENPLVGDSHQSAGPGTPHNSILEANMGGEISAKGAEISADFPFQFGRAETGGKIIMDGIRVITGAPRTSAPATSQPSITWDDHLGHTYSGSGAGIVTDAIQISAVNNLGHEIRLKKAYAVSGEGYGEKAVLIAAGEYWLPPAAVNTIAANQRMTFRLEFDSVPARELLEKWKTFQITLVYDSGVSRKDVDERMVRALYENFRPSPIGPQVTPRAKN